MTTRYSMRIMAIVLLTATLAARATETISYTYDDAGRVTQADYGGEAAIAYAYDANGNLLQRTVTAGGEVTYTLIYRAGTGGTIDGVATQIVAAGQSGTAVSAVKDDDSVVFHTWSDSRTDPTRTDTNVQADFDVTARFRSIGGADLDWYSAKGIAPEGGETWADVDARPVPAKGTTLREENLADTNPADPSDRFEILAIDPGPPPIITFRPGSPDRVYTLRAIDDLVDGTWTNVPGAGPRPGQGEGPECQDALSDENGSPARRSFYRVDVELLP